MPVVSPEKASRETQRALPDDDVTMRLWMNTISGWIIGLGLVAMMVGVDPFGVHSTWEDGGQGMNPLNLLIYGWFMVAGLGCYAIFARPRVTFMSDRVMLHNVVREVTIPYHAIEASDSMRSSHLRIQAGGRWYRAWGLERTNYAMITDRGGVAGTAEDQLSGRLTDASPPDTDDTSPADADEVEVRRRRLGPADLIVATPWLAYLIAGIAAHNW